MDRCRMLCTFGCAMAANSFSDSRSATAWARSASCNGESRCNAAPSKDYPGEMCRLRTRRVHPFGCTRLLSSFSRMPITAHLSPCAAATMQSKHQQNQQEGDLDRDPGCQWKLKHQHDEQTDEMRDDDHGDVRRRVIRRHLPKRCCASAAMLMHRKIAVEDWRLAAMRTFAGDPAADGCSPCRHDPIGIGACLDGGGQLRIIVGWGSGDTVAKRANSYCDIRH